MFDALARFADGNARRIGIFAIALLPRSPARSAARSPAASTPTAPTTPRPRRSKAEEQLQDAGLRVAGGDRRGRGRAGRRARDPGPGRGARAQRARAAPTSRRSPATTTPTPPPSSPATADSTYFAVALKPTDDKELQEAGAEIADQLAGRSRRRRRRLRGRPGAGQQAGREGPENGRDARLPAALPALAAVLPQPRRRGAAADDRRPGDRRHLPDPAPRQRIRLDLDLRPQPDHGAGAGAGDRLQPLHRLPLPRGDRQGAGRGWRRCGGCSRPPGAPSSSPR